MTWEDWINTVQCMDCLEGMKQMPDNCVDLVVTDPPYMPPAQHYASRDTRWHRCWGDYSPMVIFFQGWMQSVSRVNREASSVFVFSNDQSYPVAFVAGIDIWDHVRCLKWDKGDNYFSLGTGFVFRPRSELIAHCHNKNPRIIPGNRGDVLRYGNVPNKERSHPAEKPEDLVADLIKATTEEGDLILDPFMGSGTTAVVCKQLGRRFIGFEINPTYVRVCNERLKQTELFSGVQPCNQRLAQGVFNLNVLKDEGKAEGT